MLVFRGGLRIGNVELKSRYVSVHARWDDLISKRAQSIGKTGEVHLLFVHQCQYWRPHRQSKTDSGKGSRE